MKTLTKHTMVYDADCPLCMAYTGAFIKAGMLDQEGRIPYQQVGGEFVPGMDSERSKNEIALVNRETGEVKYGLESLLTIIETRFKWIGVIGRTQPLKFLIQKFYNFISYNRKVIIPAPLVSKGIYDCTPTFKLKYRVAYIMIVWLLTSLTLVEYSNLLGGLIPATNFYREFLICGGQVVFQSIAITVVTRKKHWDYLGNMMTVSLMGAILLLPALLLGKIFTAISPMVFLAYFMLVVGVMLFEHARRMKVLNLGWWPSMSWVIYRLLVLAVILYPS
jgi:predicted DCC family thiol-disulfide oxidoreductase YuxK